MTTQSIDYRKIVAGIAMHTRIHPAMLRAIALARSGGGEVAVVHATEKAIAGPSLANAAGMVFEDIPARCAELKARYPEITSTCIKVGTIWNALLETARGNEADLIVLSSHVHGRLSGLAGHASDRVLRRADRDVLVARTERYTEDHVPGSYRHILFATDLGDGHLHAAAQAATLARRQGARLSLLYVVEHYPVDRENEDIAPEDADPETHQRRAKGERLVRLANEIGWPDATIGVVVTADTARTAVPAYATEVAADLIVIGSRAPSALHLLLGSTADEVVHHAPCDVLVVNLAE